MEKQIRAVNLTKYRNYIKLKLLNWDSIEVKKLRESSEVT